MTGQAHIDFEVVGERTLALPGVVRTWVATGINLPDVAVEGLIVQVGSYRTSLFRNQRFSDIEPSSEGEAIAVGERLALSEVGVSGIFAQSYYLGRTAQRELLVGATDGTLADGAVVRLYHLVPADIGPDELLDDTVARLLPVPTPASAGFVPVAQADGTYRLEARATGTPSNIYATVTEFQRRQVVPGQTPPTLSSEDSTALTEQLEAASRWIDRKLGLIPGAFAPLAARTFTFRADGSPLLALAEAGRVHWLRTVDEDGIHVDLDYDGTREKTWDLSAAWLRALPLNAVALGEPYDSIEIVRHASPPVTGWPAGTTVQVTGDWGYAETPDAVRELAIGLTRDMRDVQRGGAAATITVIDGVPLKNDTMAWWRSIEAQYGAKDFLTTAPRAGVLT